jgi:hypothetical protein
VPRIPWSPSWPCCAPAAARSPDPSRSTRSLAQVVAEVFAVALWWALVVWDEASRHAANRVLRDRRRRDLPDVAGGSDRRWSCWPCAWFLAATSAPSSARSSSSLQRSRSVPSRQRSRPLEAAPQGLWPPRASCCGRRRRSSGGRFCSCVERGCASDSSAGGHGPFRCFSARSSFRRAPCSCWRRRAARRRPTSR